MSLTEKIKSPVEKIALVLKTVRNFPVFVTNYLHLFPKGRLVALNLYGQKKMYVRTGTPDPEVVVNVFSGYDYPLDLFAHNITPGGVVIDIGANIGSFVLFIKHHFATAKIHAFEPDEENYRILNANLKVNKLTDVTAVKKAVYDKIGQISFDNDTPNTGAYAVSTSGSTTVDTIDLDTYATNNKLNTIDLLKLDCEGSEYVILENFHHFDRVKSILLEYHHFNVRSAKDNDEYLINLLKREGFTVKYHDRKYQTMGTLYLERTKN